MCTPHEQHTTRLGHLRAMEQEQDTASEIEELAKGLLLLNALKGRVEESIAERKAKLRQLIRPGTSVKPVLADGGPAGVVSYSVAGIRAVVPKENEKAFTDWVIKRYPTEVEMVTNVRAPFRAKVLEVSEVAGVALGPGGEAAEDAPPVRLVNTAGVIAGRPDSDRTAELWAEIRAGATLFELEEQGQ